MTLNSTTRLLMCCYVFVFISLSCFSHVAFGIQVSVRVSSDRDDAEERISDGDMYRDSSDLELAYDDFVGGLQIVGLRFRSVNVPQGATINSAYIEFTTDETDSGTTNLIIYGEDEDSPNQFGNNDENISDRDKTTAFETWSPSAWNSVNGLHQTTDIARIIQEIVNRPGWAANNNLVIMIEPGTGCIDDTCKRTAEAHDGESASAPLLVIDYSEAGLSGNLNVDNQFEAYISADDSVEGSLIASGTNWPTTETLSANLLQGQEYYLHIKATDISGVAGFLGDFELTGTDHRFENGLTTLETDTTHWRVSTTGWGNYQPASGYGTNGVSPWGNISGVSSSAEWIWSSDNDADNLVYFTTKISTPITSPIIEYRFDEENWNGTTGEVIDNQSLGLDGTAVGNSATITGGQICNAGEFDGNGDYIDVPGLSTYLNSTASLSFWLKSSQVGNNSPWRAPGVIGVEESGGGDDIFWGYLDSSGRIGIQKGNGNDAMSNAAVSDSAWQHVVLTYESASGDVQVFIDGSLEGSATSASGDVSNVFSSIGRIEASSGLNFTGQLDELLIFDTVISADEVSTLYNNQSAGKNWDGSARVCPVTACSVAPSGELNAVGLKIDNSGSNTQIGTTTEALNIYDAWLAAGSPATGLIDGGTYNVAASGTSNVDRIDFGGSAHDFSGTLVYPGVGAGVSGSDFLVRAAGTMSLPAGDYTIYVESDDGFSFVMDSLSGDSVTFNKFGSSSSGASNELRFENPTGNSNTGGSFTLSQVSVFDIAAIFFERGGGDYLEISIANDIRTSAAPSGYEILRDGALSGKVQFGDCPNTASPDHYAISHSSPGITCEASEVTITAHDASDNAFVVASDVSLTVTTSPAVEAILPTTITIPAGASSTSFFIQQTSPLSNIDIDVTDGTASDVDGDTSGEDPLLSFVDTAFRFYANGVANAIDKQVAGEATTGQNLSLRAIKTDDQTGACISALQGPTATNVDIAYECNNPNTCSSNGLMAFEGETLTGDDQGDGPSYTSVPLVFDGNGEAEFDFTFADAGQLTLRAQTTVAANSPDPAFTLSGTSNAFWVRPSSLDISAQVSGTSLNGSSANASTTHQAGEPFDLIVRALNANGDVTPNYRPAQLQTQLTRTGPSSGGREGSLEYASSASLTSALAGASSFQNVSLESFVGGALGDGVSQYTGANYSEVGLINLDIQDIIYGGTSDDPILGDAINIGRFTPHHFDVTASNGAFSNACSGFTYLGQPFGYDPLSLPSLSIVAKNLGGDTTENYTDSDYMKLSLTGILRAFPNQDDLVNGADGAAKLTVTSNPSATQGALSVGVPGESIFTFNANDLFEYTKDTNAEVAPFSNGQLTISTTSITDSDMVTANDLSAADVTPTPVSVRYGRWVMENAFGPETKNLSVPGYMEYFTGTGYTLNTLDSCTPLLMTASSGTPDAAAGEINGITLGSSTSDLSYNTAANAGDGNLRLTAPGSGNEGSVVLNVDHSAQTWLQYDWNNDGSLQSHPGATATFGQYRGHDRIIYWREVTN